MHSFKKIALWGISIVSIGLASHASADMGIIKNDNSYTYLISNQLSTGPGVRFAKTVHGATPEPIESLFVLVEGVATTVSSITVKIGSTSYTFDRQGEGYYTLDDRDAEAAFSTLSSDNIDNGVNFSVSNAPGITSVRGIGYFAGAPEPSEPTLAIELVSYDGTNLVVNVTGGLPDKTYKITSSTDLTLPFADTGVTFDAATATGISVPSGSNTRFFVRAEEVPSGT